MNYQSSVTKHHFFFPGLLLGVFVCLAGNAEPPASSHEGQYQKNLTFVGPQTNDDITYTLYIPPSYRRQRGPYPIIFFLHGAGGGNASAEVLRSYEEARRSGVIGDCIIVFPEKFGGTVWRDGAKDKMPETNVLKDLLPFLESTYALSKDRQHRTVMGFSMGAAGALYWGAKYSELFSIVVALDAGGGTSVDDPSARNYVPQYVEKKDALQKQPLNLRIVQGALNTKGFRASLDALNIHYQYEQLPKDIEYYQEGSHCLSKKDPTRKMLHNPACLTEDTWGRDTWSFIGNNLGTSANKPTINEP